jgi:hypothetical protein
METRHLFFTLRMIWNNFMPAHMRVGNVRLYTFLDPIYTRQYFATAILQIGRELFRRTDLMPEWKAELHEMESYFAQWSEVDGRELMAPLLSLPPPEE